MIGRQLGRLGLLAHPLNQLGGHLRRHHRIAFRRTTNGIEQRVHLDVLEQIAAGPGPQRLHQILRVLGDCQHQHLHPGHFLDDDLDRLESADPRHVQVEENQIRLQRARPLYAFQPVTRLVEHLEIVMAFEQRLDAAAKQGMVIDQQHTDFFSHLTQPLLVFSAGRGAPAHPCLVPMLSDTRRRCAAPARA